MDNSFDQLRNLWSLPTNMPLTDPDRIIRIAEKQKKSTLRMHVTNIFVLAAVTAGLAAFFLGVARFKETISLVGMSLMIGGLIIRIMIEVYSIYRSSKIDLSEPTVRTNDAWLTFYEFRKKIHGPVTITIIILYTIGFYLLTPEFSLYFSLPMLILIDLSYILAAAIYTIFIRKAIRKEMVYLDAILSVQKELNKDERLRTN